MTIWTDIHYYWFAAARSFIRPNFFDAPIARLVVGVGQPHALVIHATNTSRFIPAQDMTVPSWAAYSLADYVGEPLIAIKTMDGWKSGDNSFAQSHSGYLAAHPLHNLSAGRAVLPLMVDPDVTPGDDYMLQALLRAADESAGLFIPQAGLPLSIERQVISNESATAPSSSVTYHGNVVFSEGQSAAEIDIPGIRSATAEVLLTQKDTGAGQTLFAWSVPQDDKLKITAASEAPPETWVVSYAIRHL